MSVPFTPGPWRVGSAVNGNWIEAGHVCQPVTVARTSYEAVGATIEDANARLIAEAPSMFNALEDIVNAERGSDQEALAISRGALLLNKVRSNG